MYLTIRVLISVIITALTLVIASAPSGAAGFKWFFSHVRPFGSCSPLREVAASFYWEDTRTASGERFNEHKHTIASWDYPFDTLIRVTNPGTGLSATGRVNDRGPRHDIYHLGIKLDLSRGLARAIKLGKGGRFQTGYVCMEVISTGTGKVTATKDHPNVKRYTKAKHKASHRRHTHKGKRAKAR